MQHRVKFLFLHLMFLGIIGLLFLGGYSHPVSAQQPTGSIPTVTGTPSGPLVKVALTSQIDVYSGPSFDTYSLIGVLVPGQVVPALGRSEDSSWLEIYYPGVPGSRGWVYAIYMSLVYGNLPPVVPTPLPPTPQLTSTVNPVLITAFAPEGTEARLPTFTPAQPAVIPTFSTEAGGNTRIPMGFVILALGVVGIFGAIISFLRGR
jgi:hypothetical protein